MKDAEIFLQDNAPARNAPVTKILKAENAVDI